MRVVAALELVPTTKNPSDSNIPEGTIGQPGIGYLRATIPPTRLKNDRGDSPGVFRLAQSYLSFGAQIGPQRARIEAERPKMRVGSKNMSQGLGPRPTGPRAQPSTIAVARPTGLGAQPRTSVKLCYFKLIKLC